VAPRRREKTLTRVGATGHQGLSPSSVRVIREALQQFLAPQTHLVGVTSLAGGADQIFADVVTMLRGTLEVVLPSASYETIFTDSADLSRYRSLLARASNVVQLDFPFPSEEAFMAAGREIVRRSELLVAIWDGEPAVGYGGTADVVGLARQAGVPVSVVWPTGAVRT
jgi:hypothetical protein